MTNSRRRAEPGFTLVELLVVVAIIALLIAILLPSLAAARASGKLAVCGSNLRQLGTAIHAYALESGGFIPRGPTAAYDFDFSGDSIATNRLWIGDGGWGPPPTVPRQYQGLGALLPKVCPDPKVYYCPADDGFNVREELPKIGTEQDGYGSYLYRQLERLPDGFHDGRLDSMGGNVVDEVLIPVEALAMDTDSLGPIGSRQTSHDALVLNVLFRDAAVRRFRNHRNCLALTEQAFAALPVSLLAAMDQLLTNADYGYRGGQPWESPRLDAPTPP